jgi:hypothetical protein
MPSKLKYLSLLTCFYLPANVLLHRLSSCLYVSLQGMRGNICSLFFHYANRKFPQMESHKHVICIWKISAFRDDSRLIFIKLLCKTSVPTSQGTQILTILRVNRLVLLNPLQTKRRPLYLKTQSVPRCKHLSSRL